MAKSNINTVGRDVYLVDGASKPLLLRQPFKASDLDEVIYGCMMPSEDKVNIARVIALRTDGGGNLTAYTLQRNCASGIQAVDKAIRNISHGYADLIMTGDVDAMSRAPLLLRQDIPHQLANWNRAKTAGAKLRTISQLKSRYLSPVIALMR